MPDWRSTFFLLRLLTCQCFPRRRSQTRRDNDDWAMKEQQSRAEMQMPDQQQASILPETEREERSVEETLERRRAFSGRESERAALEGI